MARHTDADAFAGMTKVTRPRSMPCARIVKAATLVAGLSGAMPPILLAQELAIAASAAPPRSAPSSSVDRGVSDSASDEIDGAISRVSRAGAAVMKRVARSVVQVVATVYRPNDMTRSMAALAKERSVGSGVVVDAAGYVMTNAHVVAGASAVDLVLEAADGDGPPQIVPATVEGVAADIDLALLRAPLADVVALPLITSASLQPGELVFAIGSPDGMRNSVSMGVVSAVARQANPDVPLPYIQTDAAVNPGQSGGALVDVRGGLVGMSTFIRSASGGNEGLAFAIPGAVVAAAFPSLRDCGFLQRATTGMSLQAITPGLQAGLGLREASGLVVANVVEGGPAANAGLRVGDVVTAIDALTVARGMNSLDLFLHAMRLQDGQVVTLVVDRAGQPFVLKVRAALQHQACPSRPALLQPDVALVDELGVFGRGLSSAEARAGGRLRAGVHVDARVALRSKIPPLAPGDIVCAVNGIAVDSVTGLRAALAAAGPNRVLVLQIERGGRLTYLEYDRE